MFWKLLTSSHCVIKSYIWNSYYKIYVYVNTVHYMFWDCLSNIFMCAFNIIHQTWTILGIMNTKCIMYDDGTCKQRLI